MLSPAPARQSTARRSRTAQRRARAAKGPPPLPGDAAAHAGCRTLDESRDRQGPDQAACDVLRARALGGDPAGAEESSGPRWRGDGACPPGGGARITHHRSVPPESRSLSGLQVAPTLRPQLVVDREEGDLVNQRGRARRGDRADSPGGERVVREPLEIADIDVC